MTKKKLIEVALPLDAINEASAREKSIRHGHPSTLHLWWARRPLAACRAVLFAQLVDDPSAHPDVFEDEAAQDAERERLFDIIRKLVKWQNPTDGRVLAAARAEIVKSCDGNPPPILDPFAGGGSIPLEAQRLGLEAHASDLNPVAVLICKALIEFPPRWAGRPPVHPDADNRTRWRDAEGLAEDVRRYGAWMRDEAEREIGHLYPKAKLPDGSEANVIVWFWARTVTCPNPACGATMPLASSFWLGKKRRKEAWIKPAVEGKQVCFEIGHGPQGPPDPPKLGRGAKFRCLVCNSRADDRYVHDEIDEGRSGNQLMAIAAEGVRERVYLSPTDEHAAASAIPRPDNVPVAECRGTFGGNAQGRRYGFRTFADYFTNRQLTALMTFSDLVGKARSRAECDALAAGLTADEATAYATAVATYLAFAISKLADRGSTICTWVVERASIRNTFTRQAIPMTWDFVENNAFTSGTGSFMGALDWTVESLEGIAPSAPGTASQLDARETSGTAVIATDPPYYDNIGYADLADFFYIWLRQSLRKLHPELFATMVTPKDAELIATPYRHGGSIGDSERFFQEGFAAVFTRARHVHMDGFPLSLFYAFKQSEVRGEGDLVSTGWATMLEGLHSAGWMVTATWPMRTERSDRSVALETNSLASSVVLACRPRPETAGITDRQGFVRALKAELPGAVHELQKAAIAPVDLRQAAIGPGMAVFSRFARVVDANGDTMRVRTALGLINQVLGEVLDEQEATFDAQTRWAIAWFEQYFFDEKPYGLAEQLAVSMDVSVTGMKEAGVLASGGGKVRLLRVDELPQLWDPLRDRRTPVWEATHHLVKRLDDAGTDGAGGLLRRLGGLGESAQLLAYRLYTICETPRPALAGPYNALVQAWPQIQAAAHSGPTAVRAPAPVQGSLDGESDA